MDKHLTDNSTIELDNPLYMQERIKILEQALDEIEKLTDIREVHGLTDTEYVENFRLHQKRILDIINKAKEQ